jgi:hypothetical protein
MERREDSTGFRVSFPVDTGEEVLQAVRATPRTTVRSRKFISLREIAFPVATKCDKKRGSVWDSTY